MAPPRHRQLALCENEQTQNYSKNNAANHPNPPKMRVHVKGDVRVLLARKFCHNCLFTCCRHGSVAKSAYCLAEILTAKCTMDGTSAVATEKIEGNVTFTQDVSSRGGIHPPRAWGP